MAAGKRRAAGIQLTDDGKTCIDLPAECVDYVFDFCDDAALYGTMTSGNNGQETKAVRIDLTTVNCSPCRWSPQSTL